tara:strand:- start:69 stop:368 length:300 start_codon:yes stop_codon:yes gene_type:complete
MNTTQLIKLAILALATSAPAYAQETLEMEGTAIVGNKELPRVLYIVPWKSTERFDISTPQVVSIMEQQLSKIDRPSFKRKIHYHDAIFARAKPASNPNQ